MFVVWQRLSKNVRDLIIHGDIFEGDIAILDLFTYEMMTNTDAFCPCVKVKGRVRCKCNGTLVVDKESCRIGKGEPDIS